MIHKMEIEGIPDGNSDGKRGRRNSIGSGNTESFPARIINGQLRNERRSLADLKTSNSTKGGEEGRRKDENLSRIISRISREGLGKLRGGQTSKGFPLPQQRDGHIYANQVSGRITRYRIFSHKFN